MLRFWKKAEKVEKVEEIETIEGLKDLKIFSVHKIRIPEFEAACLRASGDTSLDALVEQFSVRRAIRTEFLVQRQDEPVGYAYKLALSAHMQHMRKKLIEHLESATISKEAAQLLMSIVKTDSEQYIHIGFVAQFEDGIEISGENASDILEKAEEFFAGRETPKLVLMRKIVELRELIRQRVHA